jgi:hypothetical protein
MLWAGVSDLELPSESHCDLTIFLLRPFEFMYNYFNLNAEYGLRGICLNSSTPLPILVYLE